MAWQRVFYSGHADKAPEAQAPHGRLAPFVELSGLLRSGGAEGILRRGECLVPFRRLFPAGLACGGYLHSEATTLAVGDTNWDGLGTSLAGFGVSWLLAEAPEEDPALDRLCGALRQAGWALCFLPGRTSPYIDFPLENDGDFYVWLREANAKEFRNLRASRRKLEAAGGVDIRFVEGELSPELADRLGEVEEKSSKKGIGIFSPARRKATLALLGRTPVRLALLRIEGNLVAWDLDFECESVVYSYNRAYDQAFAALAPGKILHYENLARAFANGVGRAELLGDADALKMRIATGTRQRTRLAAFRPNAAGALAHALFRLRQGVKRRSRGGQSQQDRANG